MQLISLQLENIRSYTTEKINFGTGKVLLRGDIGSGKSTILLAIEFALFGLMRGLLSGSALLRHNKRRGSVTLEFKANGQHIFIKRALKRSKNSIEQAEGVIIIDEVVHNLTPTELKMRILKILGYPTDLLTKNKSLIYRYTVYTPQEDMKRILLENPETRINILRKLFDIDKYKRIVDNLNPYLKKLRDQQKEKEGYISDLAEKQKQREAKLVEKKSIEIQLIEFTAKLTELKINKEVKKTVLAQIETRIKAQQELKTLVVTSETRLKSLREQKQDLTNRFDRMNAFIAEQNIQPVQQTVLELKQMHEEYGKNIELHDTQFRENLQKISVCTAHINQSKELKQSISSLSECPTCLQAVSPEYKQVIDERETEKISRVKLKLLSHLEKQTVAEKKLNELKQSLEELRDREKQALLNEVKLKGLDETKKELGVLTERFESLKVEEKNLLDIITKTRLEIEDELEKKLRSAKEDYAAAVEKEQDQQILVNSLQQKVKFAAEVITNLKIEIMKKEDAKKQMHLLRKNHSWLADFFVPLSANIEKHVLSRIYHGFNDLFVRWFKELLQDDGFSARLDEYFTPLIEQNGYETEIENLSGGERTACALAYRLALTKVINSLITSIKTNDLLILDEPTDGFSSEQLDRMREVLDNLGLAQIIIVSHERKIESFVDTIISIEKQDNTSRALQS